MFYFIGRSLRERRLSASLAPVVEHHPGVSSPGAARGTDVGLPHGDMLLVKKCLALLSSF